MIDDNDELTQYLLDQKKRREQMLDPDYQASVRAPGNAIASQNNMNNLYAALADSASKFGSVGGKTADASSVRKMADSSAQNNQQFLQQMGQADQGREQNRNKQEALTEYLLNKKAEQAKLQSGEERDKAKLLRDEQRQDAQFGRQQESEDKKLAFEREKLNQSKDESQARLAKEKAPNKEQFDAAQYGKRVAQANSIMDTLSKGGYNRADATVSTILPNMLKDDDLQQQEQAERNFVNAVLRRESGAAIAPSEFESAQKQYFPRNGDSPNVLAQKRQNRLQAQAGLQAASGQAWEKVPSIALEGAAEPGTANAATGKQIVKKQYSPSRKQTKITYSDGTTEVVDGQ